jgi:chemotaxis protein methyltransferase CheR
MLQSDNNRQELRLEDFIVFRDFIHERSGMFFAENKKYLIENRLSKRMAALGLKSFKDYFYQVKYDTSQKEFNTLMNLVTTNETSFYRNPPQLRSFQEEVLPLIIKEKQQAGSFRRLKIWSAGCSTGEEPYTIAIIAREVLGADSPWSVEIIANDISEQVLYAARKGIYNEMTLRTTPPEIVAKYFRQDGGRYVIDDSVKRLVKFSHLNLSDKRKLGLVNECDIIFCRNVMIYFSDEVKKQIIKGFYSSLRPGGYLFIGHSESLHGISKSFKLVYFKHGLVYHKEPSQTAVASTETARAAAKAAVAVSSGAAHAAAGSTGAAAGDSSLEKLRKIRELLSSTQKQGQTNK